MIKFFKRIYHGLKSSTRLFNLICWLILNVGYKFKILSVYKIPIIVNNFNRLTYPTQLLNFLDTCGFTNIIILDNQSSYQPLLDFYKNCKYQVIKFDTNYGHLALWKSGLYNKYKWNYFIYTDSDVVPVEDCPKDFIELFKRVLDKNYRIDKIGFGIKIDDLPDTFHLKNEIIRYEKRYWTNEVSPNLYDAPIDTTFALYKPLSNLKNGEIYTLLALRTGPPYVVRHLPWYINSKELSEEEQFYLQTCNDSSSLSQHQRGNRTVY